MISVRGVTRTGYAVVALIWLAALPLLLTARLADAKDWFPFDMAVADFWAAHENGSRIPAGGSVQVGTPLILHCNWTVRPTEGTDVLKELVGYPNLVTVDGHSQGIFPIKIPPGGYGGQGKHYTEGGVNIGGVQIGGKSVNVNPGIQELKGEFTTGWTVQGGGPHKLSCILDSAGQVASLEKNRSNNRRDVSITAIAIPPLTAEEIPVPEIVAPLKAPGGEVIQLSLDANSVALAGRIPSVKFKGWYFWDWAKSLTVFEERWHLQLLKRQPSGMFKPVETFSGVVTKQEYQRMINPGFFDIDKDGGGIWRLKTWLTQEKTPQGVVTGKASTVDFEVKLLSKKHLAATPGAIIVPKHKDPSLNIGGGFTPSTAKPATGIIAAAIKPNLSVASAMVKIEPNCQAPLPAMTVAVTIKNNGGALTTGKGHVFVKEIGGANLSSGGIPLPAIGAGQTQSVDIPAITLQPYSSLVGAHQVHVKFNPQSDGGQLSFNQPAAPYIFSATFPPGHCKPSQRQAPVPSGSHLGSPSTQAPAVQANPGSSGEPKPAQPQRR